jgi:hypothetical protein
MTNTRNALRLAGLAAAFALTAAGASAQQEPYQQPEGPPPGPAAQGPVPSYALAREPAIRGIVSRIDGKYQIHVRDVKGYVDNVTLHQGTVINPTGLPLAPGERVLIIGHPNGPAFEAEEIDIPYAPGYRRPYWYPAYYPAISVGIWGGGGWGWRGRGWW